MRIGPFKVEELYLEPRVIKIYDAVTDNEINQIIDKSKGKVSYFWKYKSEIGSGFYVGSCKMRGKSGLAWTIQIEIFIDD